jgi:regulator of replication initiation timing
MAETTDEKIDELRARVEDLLSQIGGLGQMIGVLTAEMRLTKANLDELRKALQRDHQSDPEE